MRLRSPINISSNVNPLTAQDENTWISQIVLSVEDPGTNWSFRMEDRDTPPHVLIPTFTMGRAQGLLTDVVAFAIPIFMQNGINVFTTGNAGKLSLWLYTEMHEWREKKDPTA